MAKSCAADMGFQQQFRECAGIDCDFGLKGLSLSPYNELDVEEYPKYANAFDCHIKWKPYSTQKECPACPTGEPIVYDGVPLDYQMESFLQPFEICPTDRDIFNDAIKQRLLWNERGPVELSSIPAYKACGPTLVQIKRNGVPVPRDGIVTTAQNLSDADAESDLLNITKPVVYRDTVGFEGNKPNCYFKYQSNDKSSPKASYAKAFEDGKVNPTLFSRQLYSEYDPTKNPQKLISTRPCLFNNCSRAKISGRL